MSLHALRARAARAGLHAPVAWFRNFGLDSADVLIASHGRSGDTMLRFILGEILSGVPISFDNIQRIVPEIGMQSNSYPILPGHGRLIKTHEPYCRKYKRAIYLIRDARDAMLSLYAREMAVNCIHPNYRDLDDYISAFFQGKVSHFGAWQDHVASWMNSTLARSGDLLVVRFEDMRRDPEGVISRCLGFLGQRIDPFIVQTAIRNNSLEKMRIKEDQSTKFPKVPGESGRQVGRGEIEGWRQTLTEQQLRIVDKYAGETLAHFHYPSSVTSRGAGNRKELKQKVCSHASARIQPMAYGDVFSPTSNIHPESKVQPVANRALHVRIGGRIASFFSWYRY
jgi:Sulfotransferase domain